MSTPDVADLSTWTDLIRPVEDIAELRALLLEVVEEGIAAHPRSAQAEIGPSEVGDPCARKLAHKFAGTPRREQPPMWRAAVGTSIDAQLKDWCHAWNEAHGTRFLTDVKVYVSIRADPSPAIWTCWTSGRPPSWMSRRPARPP
jgi:hypothetical protein